MISRVTRHISTTIKESKYEFLKLDDVDLKVASWIYEHHPKALYSYLEFLVEIDGNYFNVDKAYADLMKLFQLK